VREFTEAYLDRTRRGMWEDSREALADLSLSDREAVLDVGAGTGEFSAVLADGVRSVTRVVALDADPGLLARAREAGRPVVVGDATRLPVRTDAFDLVTCQALLVNLPEPGPAVREFARASRDLVAAVEPHNGDVGVASTVDAEPELERRAREAYLAGVRTDVAPGERVADLFREAGLSVVGTRRYHHEKRVAPPYDEAAMRAATRKATGEGLADHEAELRRALSGAAYDALRSEWREMGREVVAEMRAGEYERVELVPFDVTVGRV
jgi:SAM-dependent methyltransferase